MKRVIFFAGLPGSGKTTICQLVAKTIGANYVDVDQHKLFRTDPNKLTKEVDPPEIRILYCKDAINEAFDHFEKGITSVVMDEVYPYHSVRSELENQCKEQSIEVFWVEVRSSCGTAEKRLTKERVGHILSPEEAKIIHKMCAEAFESFIPSTPNHIIINNEDGIDLNLSVQTVLDRI